jgi:hypothetical protein
MLSPEMLLRVYCMGLRLSYKLVDIYLDRRGLSEQHYENIRVVSVNETRSFLFEPISSYRNVSLSLGWSLTPNYQRGVENCLQVRHITDIRVYQDVDSRNKSDSEDVVQGQLKTFQRRNHGKTVLDQELGPNETSWSARHRILCTLSRTKITRLAATHTRLTFALFMQNYSICSIAKGNHTNTIARFEDA